MDSLSPFDEIPAIDQSTLQMGSGAQIPTVRELLLYDLNRLYADRAVSSSAGNFVNEISIQDRMLLAEIKSIIRDQGLEELIENEEGLLDYFSSFSQIHSIK